MTTFSPDSRAVLKTSMGDVTIAFLPDKAPRTCEHFAKLARQGFYDGLSFHRVIKDFMVQGGGMTSDGKQKPTKPPIKNEADNGLKNDVGTLAMARTSVVDSATAQFFINTKNNDFLNNGSRDFGYAVFGKVTGGMEVVRKIEAVETRPGDAPKEPVIIKSIKRKS
jgi:cyclophilin family peptidyl-prolyl cis-trans isomerase